jgi:hypothetical protein
MGFLRPVDEHLQGKCSPLFLIKLLNFCTSGNCSIAGARVAKFFSTADEFLSFEPFAVHF